MTEAGSLPKRFTSPGEAFSAQRTDEDRFLRAAMTSTQSFLEKVKSQALSRELTSASARGAWSAAVLAAMNEFGEDPKSDVGRLLAGGLTEDNLGDGAYLSAMAVLNKSASTYPAPSVEEISKALDEALSLETASLVAAGGFLHSINKALTSIGLPWRSRVERTVRTGFTGFTGAVTQAALSVVTPKLQKRWVAHHDDRVRDTHLEADGQTIGINESFVVGAATLRYPGDRTGLYSEIVYCRCVIVGVSV